MTLRIALLSTLAAAAVLAGCTTATGPQVAPGLTTSLSAWEGEVKVLPTPEQIALAPHDTGLSVNQSNSLEDFVGHWMKAEARDIVVSAPDKGPGAQGANRVAWDARDRLLALGVPARRIRMLGYDAADDAKAPVLISFNHYSVDVPTCGAWRDLSHSNDNRAYDNFGCALTANMAAQVSNPQDLLGPRDMDPADARQRDAMYDKYQKGAATGSERNEKASGTVSQVVN